MLKSVEGVYRDGKIELLEPAPDDAAGRVYVHRGKYDFAGHTGKRLLLNVYADGPTSTTILVNIGTQSFSWQSPFGYHKQVQIAELASTFGMYDDSLVFELEQVQNWWRWVPSVRRAVGDILIGNIRMGEKTLGEILRQLQRCSSRIDQFAKALDSLEVDSVRMTAWRADRMVSDYRSYDSNCFQRCLYQSSYGLQRPTIRDSREQLRPSYLRIGDPTRTPRFPVETPQLRA